MFGQIRPIVVEEKNTILAGKGLYETLLRMGEEQALVYKYEEDVYKRQVWEIVGDIGKQNTNILDLYMLAFKLATDQLQSLSLIHISIATGKQENHAS